MKLFELRIQKVSASISREREGARFSSPEDVQVAEQATPSDRLPNLSLDHLRRLVRLERSEQAVVARKRRREAIHERDEQAVRAPQFGQGRRTAKVARERLHVGRVVDAVLDSSGRRREEVVVGRRGRQGRHLAREPGSPPHALLLGDRRDGACLFGHGLGQWCKAMAGTEKTCRLTDSRSDKSNERNIRHVGFDNVTHGRIPRSRVVCREPVGKVLLITGSEDDETARKGGRQVSRVSLVDK